MTFVPTLVTRAAITAIALPVFGCAFLGFDPGGGA